MLVIDKQKLDVDRRNTLLHPELEKFATQVSFVKPLCKFVADKKSISSAPYESSWQDAIVSLKLYQNGEEVGEVFVAHQYRQNKRETLYGIRSFRINKNRGERNATTSKDMKVALRNAKKLFVARELDELRSLIDDKVRSGMRTLMYGAGSRLTDDMDVSQEIKLYVVTAYQARRKNESTVTVPSNLVSISPQKMDNHDKACETYMEIYALNEYYKAKLGYGIKVMADDVLIVLNYATTELYRVNSYNELPENIQNKFAMFKILKECEPYAHLGCKFSEGILYISPDS